MMPYDEIPFTLGWERSFVNQKSVCFVEPEVAEDTFQVIGNNGINARRATSTSTATEAIFLPNYSATFASQGRA